MDDLERRLRKTLTSVAHAPDWSPHDQVPLDEITCAGELRLARRRVLWLLGAGAVLIVLLFLS